MTRFRIVQRFPNEARVCALDELVLSGRRPKNFAALAQERQAFDSINEYALAVELAVNLGKQSGWRGYVCPRITTV